MKVLLRTGFVLFSVVSAFSAFAEDRVIYGEDNRRDLYDPKVDESLVELSRSTAILIRDSDLGKDRATSVSMPKRTLKSSVGVCETEPFANQLNPGFCSGFLVGPDTFVTAGHCITSQSQCDGVSMIFGFGLDKETRDLSTVNASEVYHCKKVIRREYQSSANGRDYAVVTLDRVVKGRAPLKVRQTGSVQVGDSIAVIGHPSGLPTKIADGAKVRSVKSADPYFQANLDTYGGNSGSAVFNMVTGEVEGILVRGENDFVRKGDCMVSNVCKDNACRGEDVTKTELFKDLVPGN